jgi:hypothetical protein
MSHSIQCTHCHATLKSSKPVPAGKQVTCPKCKQAFTTPTDGPTTKFETTTSLDAPPPPAPEPEPALGDDDLDAAIAKLQAEQSAGKKPAAAPAAPPPPPKPVIPNMEIPEDEDLVDPEPEETPQVEPQAMVEPAPSKNRQNTDDDDEPRARRKRDDDEDDEPRSKRRRADDDDEPRSKRKRRDEEDDDEPRSKRKRDDEEEDEDDAPRSKRKRRDRDHDDDDDDPRRVKKKVKKGGSGAMLWILLAVGGVLGLLLCCGGGVGVYFFLPGVGPMGGPNIVGRWENRDIIQVVYEFKGNGTGQIEAFGTITWFDYRQRGDKLELTTTRVQALGMDVQVPRRTDTLQVSRDGDTLRLDGVEGRRGAFILHKIN